MKFTTTNLTPEANTKIAAENPDTSKGYITPTQLVEMSDLTSGPVTSSAGVSSIADAALSIAKTNGLQTALDTKITNAAVPEAANAKGVSLLSDNSLGGTATGSLVLANLGDPNGADGSALAALDVGVWKNAGIGFYSRNLHWNNVGRWDLGNTSYPACGVEVGQEGITLHTAAVGSTSLNTQHHEILQVRNASVDTPPASGTYYTGPTVQVKAPLSFVYRPDSYATLGDAHPWQPGSIANADAPFIWMSSAYGDHEVDIRLDNSGASNSGGEIIQFRKSRGTSAANSGDYAGFIDFYFKGTSAYLLSSRIFARAEAAPTTTALSTINIGATGKELKVHSSGAVGIKALTVATLPSAATLGAGARSFVTDANATHAAGLGTVVAGGGANAVPVYSDGTNWRIGG